MQLSYALVINVSSPIQWVGIKLVKIHGKSQASDI